MKKAVILFNLGGPDNLESVEPFLFNLFNDPAIISIPSFLRYLSAAIALFHEDLRPLILSCVFSFPVLRYPLTNRTKNLYPPQNIPFWGGGRNFFQIQLRDVRLEKNFYLEVR